MRNRGQSTLLRYNLMMDAIYDDKKIRASFYHVQAYFSIEHGYVEYPNTGRNVYHTTQSKPLPLITGNIQRIQLKEPR